MTQPDPSLGLTDQDLSLDDETRLTQAGCAATRDLVFVAAERLFAVHGFQKVSVRDITAEAKVNLASINYHFGSKDALLLEIFTRRTAELNRARAKMLHEANAAHAGKPPVRAVLHALIAPPVFSRARNCSTSPSSTRTEITADASKYKPTAPCMSRNSGGNHPGASSATTLYEKATPVPIAISVYMLRLRDTSDCQPKRSTVN